MKIRTNPNPQQLRRAGRTILPLLALALLPAMSTAQTTAGKQDSTVQTETISSPFTLSGFIEVYYAYDFAQPIGGARPSFIYSHNRHNEFNINLAFLRGSYNKDRVRANLALATGTYMNASYAAEPGVLKNIYEANAGVKISKKHDLWIDAGVMSSHLGFESAQTSTSWTLTRSMTTENSPYYESGAKLGYTSKNGKWYLAGMLLNGWQRIQRPPGNSTLAAGTQITYKSGAATLNYSTFFGNDLPDKQRLTRIFHNVYGIFQLSEKLGLIADFDFGMQQRTMVGSDWNNWFGGALLIRYKTGDKTAVTARGEYYQDKNGVIVATTAPYTFNMSAVSANFDYSILENALWRIEGKLMNNEDPFFAEKGGTSSKSNVLITTSLSVSF